MSTSSQDSQEAITIEHRGEITFLTPAPSLEKLDYTMADPVAAMMTQAILGRDVPLVVIDLSTVSYFGSVFLAVLTKLWKQICSQGGTMVLVGVSPNARELLHLTSLDIIWPMYESRIEAIEALTAD